MFQFLPPRDTSSQKKEDDSKSRKMDSNKAWERYMNYYKASQQPYGGMLSHESAAQLKAEGREITPSKYIQTGTESSGANDEVQLKKNPIQRFVKEEGEEELMQRKVAQKSEEEEEEPLQTKTIQMAGAQEEEELMQGKFMQKKGKPGNNATPVSDGTNTQMPENVQAKMEGSFGTSFGNVNIHQNDSSATQMNALAYTQGNDVHFAPGQYNPQSKSGQELLGHELTHVVQQRAGKVQATNQQKGVSVNDNPALEQEADDMGKKAANDRNVNVSGVGNGVQKQEDTKENTRITSSGPFSEGVPSRPTINHNNGFLDAYNEITGEGDSKYAEREPNFSNYAKYAKWNAMLEGSEILRPDLVDANAAYRHFLQGGGADRNFDYERFL